MIGDAWTLLDVLVSLESLQCIPPQGLMCKLESLLELQLSMQIGVGLGLACPNQSGDTTAATLTGSELAIVGFQVLKTNTLVEIPIFIFKMDLCFTTTLVEP